MLDFQAIEKPTMDRFDLISTSLLHREYAKVDAMKSGYSMLIQEPKDKHDERVEEHIEVDIHTSFFA